MFCSGKIARGLCTLVVLTLAWAGAARASATLLLEEPYGKLGFFTATGHAAVYLSGVCAETPLVLRPCAPGALGAVISRYDGVGGYDWVAIPLIPYLYAVDHAEDIPLFADAKMVNLLRDHYRRKYLAEVAPDAKNGEAPGGNGDEPVALPHGVEQLRGLRQRCHQLLLSEGAAPQRCRRRWHYHAQADGEDAGEI